MDDTSRGWGLLLGHPRGPHVATSGDFATAMDTLRRYEWNLAASAAAHTVLSIVEIALRNALDRSLRRWNPSQGATCSSDWTVKGQ